MRRRALALLLALALAAPGGAAAAETPPLPDVEWSFEGLFGTFDRASVRRGFQVYSEVCVACHSLNQLYYRSLGQIGYGAEEVAEIAAQRQVTAGPNDEGEMFERPGQASDRFVAPFPNENAARAANNGAAPPDLSLMVKAREGGADYLYAILTGFREQPPAGVTAAEGMYYNDFFDDANEETPGGQIAMAPPLNDDQVQYADGTEATVEQMARDVATFLAWSAEPELETRKRMGIKVILFLLVLTGMFYAVKRKVWSRLH